MLPISIANAGRYKKQHAPVYLIFGFNLCNCFEALLLMEMKITFGCTSCICSTRVQHVPAVTSQWRLLLPISQLNFLASCSAVYKVINMMVLVMGAWFVGTMLVIGHLFWSLLNIFDILYGRNFECWEAWFIYSDPQPHLTTFSPMECCWRCQHLFKKHWQIRTFNSKTEPKWYFGWLMHNNSLACPIQN